VQVAVETSWSWWSDDDAKSTAILDVRRTALVTQVLTRLNALHPGLSRRVRRAEVITPDQFHAATGAHQGITGGWLGTVTAARHPLPQRITGLRNVYRAGQWAASAPGALAAMHAGRQAAQLLAADLGLRESAAPRAIS
jgi:phytoene dehydrogenase-like protein